MKKFILLAAIALGFSTAPAMASGTSAAPVVKVKKATDGYVKKDKAYWTRVWYEKQARKGKTYKKRVATKTKRKATKRRVSTGGRILAKVDLSSQRMNVYKGGRLVHSWKVSTGRKGYGTPTGTWRIHRMHKRYFSRKYNGAPMPYAMFYYRGFAVHGTNAISRLGRPASHGCVRLHPNHAAKLFSMVQRSGGVVKVTY